MLTHSYGLLELTCRGTRNPSARAMKLKRNGLALGPWALLPNLNLPLHVHHAPMRNSSSPPSRRSSALHLGEVRALRHPAHVHTDALERLWLASRSAKLCARAAICASILASLIEGPTGLHVFRNSEEVGETGRLHVAVRVALGHLTHVV